MACLPDIQAANGKLHERHESLTAVFTGATNGIGLGTLQAFVQYVPHPTAIIAGRNAHAFEKEIVKLKQLNSNAEIVFLEADLSLIKNIDAVSEQIASRLPPNSIDLLCMSQGSNPINGREFTTEGLDKCIALAYYGRMRLLQRLATSHVLQPEAVVLSILIGGKEGKVFEDDLALERNYSIMNMRAQMASLTTLSLDAVAKRHPGLSLLHVYPGAVDTGILARDVRSWVLWMVMVVVEKILMWYGRAVSPQEAGEMMLDLALGGGFGKGVFSIDIEGVEGRSEWLKRYREDEAMADGIWKFNEEVWTKALAA